MRRIFITRNIPEAGIKMLRARRGINIDIFEKDRAISRWELLRRARGADVILSILTDKIDGAVMDAAGPQLRMIANYAVGFDNVDLAAAKTRNITVTNAPCPEISESVAEHVIALIFALAHRVVETDEFTRRGKYKGWGPQLLLGSDVAGKTLGIVGAGAIGSALARRMRDGFGAHILYHDVHKNPDFEKAFGATYKTLPQLLKGSDFVSLHVPLLPATHHLISEKELRAMKSTGYLINTARGPVVDQAALISALKNGDIAGAGLDVFEHEPSVPRALRKLPNAVITPHTASATRETRDAMSRQVATNILAFLSGRRPINAIK